MEFCNKYEEEVKDDIKEEWYTKKAVKGEVVCRGRIMLEEIAETKRQKGEMIQDERGRKWMIEDSDTERESKNEAKGGRDKKRPTETETGANKRRKNREDEEKREGRKGTNERESKTKEGDPWHWRWDLWKRLGGGSGGGCGDGGMQQ